jgi:hypothetical protein
MPNEPGFFQVIKKKYHISDNAYEHFDFCITGQNIYLGRAAFNQPLTEGNTIWTDYQLQGPD